MKEVTSKSILVGKRAYFYLHREMRKQRGCKPLTKDAETRIWNRHHKIGNKVQLTGDSMGGGDGTYDGHWTDWSIDTLKKMLDEKNYSYTDGPDVISINLSARDVGI